MRITVEFKREARAGFRSPAYTFSFSDYDLTGVHAPRKVVSVFGRGVEAAAHAMSAELEKLYGIKPHNFGVLAKPTKAQPVGLGEFSFFLPKRTEV